MTPEEMQAEIDSLKTKLANSQNGREADNRAAEEKLDKTVEKIDAIYGDRLEAIKDENVKTVRAAIEDERAKSVEAVKANEALHKTAAEKMQAAFDAALTTAKAEYLESAKVWQATLAASSAELAAAQTEVARLKAIADQRREALYTARKLLTDADQVVSGAIKE